MKYLVIILSIIMTGCSAQWHLNKALKKDPKIIDTKADTVINKQVTFSDTVIQVEKQVKFKVLSDTVTVDSIVIKEVNQTIEPFEIVSNDSIAHARVSIYKGKLNIKVWAVLDTLVYYKDSIRLKNKTIENQKTVIQENKATIKEKSSFIDKLKLIAFGIGGVFLVFFVVLIVVKF